jgi:glycosyltransferase involved in cell wall biosynthesis
LLKILNVLFIEPYDGGSHKAFREGLLGHSRHRFTCLTLPPRFWKWRMRSAAAYFADIINAGHGPPCDLIVATDYLNFADLRGLLAPPWDRIPCLLYMHENQLTYPLSPQEEFDFHFGFTNIISALAADRLVFNSEYHRQVFLGSLSDYLAKMPEAVPRGIQQRLQQKSHVLAVGIERRPHGPDAFPPYLGGPCTDDVGPPWPRDRQAPLILWNHRWEFDKRPELLAAALTRLDQEGVPFRVLLLGEPRNRTAVFAPLRQRLGERCLACGFLPSRAEYNLWLERTDIVVSCAIQEYFGISVAEAVQAGAYPVLPRHQVYPSLYGSQCKGRHFYTTEEELVALLRDLLRGTGCGHVCSLPLDSDAFCWENLIVLYDDLLQEAAQSEVKA